MWLGQALLEAGGQGSATILGQYGGGLAKRRWELAHVESAGEGNISFCMVGKGVEVEEDLLGICSLTTYGALSLPW